MRAETQAQPTASPLTRQLHRALLDLYDPPQLARSPLLARPDLARQPDPPAALRRTLLEAVEALKPADATPPQANAWRTYRILLHRYVQQIPQREIAASLGFSVRQLQRHEQAALQILADHWIARYGAPSAGAPPAPAAAPSAASEGELARLRASFASEAVSLAEVVQAALRTARPLLDAAQVAAGVAVAPQLPRVAAQGIPMRQALVSIFTAAAHCAPGGRIEIHATPESGQVRLVVRPMRDQSRPGQGPAAPAGLCPDDSDNMAMARQLVALSGGSLQWCDGIEGPFVATLILPAAEQFAVLAIDDNLDSLHLLQRFLEGSRYPIIAEQNPIRAVELAREIAPRIIILDVMLPGLDGWELLGRLREHPTTRDIPVIISTILPHEQLALTLGAAAFLRKPVTRADLLAVLDALAAVQDVG